MKYIYLVTTYNVISGEAHSVVAAFSSFDKAEDFYDKKMKSQVDYSYDYLIETLAVDVENAV